MKSDLLVTFLKLELTRAWFQILLRIVSWQLRKVGGRIALASDLADINVVAEAVSQKRGLPVDVRIPELSS
jgi:hypothetical protein